MKRFMIGLLFVLLGAVDLQAQPSFFEGKTIRIVVGLPAGDGGRLVAGGLTIDRVITAPNGRAGTAAVIVALTYAGRLTLSLRFERDALSETSASELLEAFLAQLRETSVSRQAEPVLV